MNDGGLSRSLQWPLRPTLERQAREKTGLTQAAFAQRIDTPVATLRDWEQGRFTPPGGVLCLLRLIIKHPELSLELNVA
ncbi:MAG: helix-turn-helix domain-containing protein [Burkholderiaceae bacterium]|nr:helix-turn-helix domain-containing protein [Burkholderiaceae bacterium]